MPNVFGEFSCHGPFILLLGALSFRSVCFLMESYQYCYSPFPLYLNSQGYLQLVFLIHIFKTNLLCLFEGGNILCLFEGEIERKVDVKTKMLTNQRKINSLYLLAHSLNSNKRQKFC